MKQRRFTEVDLLLKKVKEKFKEGAYTTNDYKMLSDAISECGAGYLSTSTLKRLFGYVNDMHRPTVTTLDIISRYIGYKCYEDFYTEILDSCTLSSSFLADNQIWSNNLSLGDVIELGWAPNRYLQLKYNGDSFFQVVESQNSKLLVGDSFKVAIFMLNEPLYIPMVYRDSQEVGPYIAGVKGGLVTLNKCVAE